MSFAVYCSATMDDGYFGWYPLGGTSAGAPQWAALVAIAAQGRELAGTSPLDGFTQTLPALYQMSASNFHDVTQGNNGYDAGAGYDLVTGLGSPVADRIVSDLQSTPGALSYSQMRAAYRATTTLVVDKLMQKPTAGAKALWTLDRGDEESSGVTAMMTSDQMLLPLSETLRSADANATGLRLVCVDEANGVDRLIDGSPAPTTLESHEEINANRAKRVAGSLATKGTIASTTARRLRLVDVDAELNELSTLAAAA
jgi:hypothetical protein